MAVRTGRSRPLPCNLPSTMNVPAPERPPCDTTISSMQNASSISSRPGSVGTRSRPRKPGVGMWERPRTAQPLARRPAIAAVPLCVAIRFAPQNGRVLINEAIPSPTRAWQPPSSTASRSTPTSSKPAATATGSAPPPAPRRRRHQPNNLNPLPNRPRTVPILRTIRDRGPSPHAPGMPNQAITVGPNGALRHQAW